MSPHVKSERYRDEITRRTKKGETAIDISQALAERGIDISRATINRWRLAWGLRQRPPSAVAGRKYPGRRRRSSREPSAPAEDESTDAPFSKAKALAQAQADRKAEITMRTLRGESAEQIAKALEAKGFVLKGGASSIWRLQSRWQLENAEEGLCQCSGQHEKCPALHREDSNTSYERTASPAQAASPSIDERADGNESHSVESEDPRDSPVHVSTSSHSNSIGAQTAQNPEQLVRNPAASLNGATGKSSPADLASAELLVDLATSNLAWANHLRDLYIARRAQRSVADTADGQPPNEADFAHAKTKICQGAAVIYDIVMAEVDDVEPSLTS